MASLLYVLALGLGLRRVTEGIICAVLITANELVLRAGKGRMSVSSSKWHESFYTRHHGMIGHFGLLHLGAHCASCLLQLPHRDIASLVSLLLPLSGPAP